MTTHVVISEKLHSVYEEYSSNMTENISEALFNIDLYKEQLDERKMKRST